jgi:hypothetical protein
MPNDFEPPLTACHRCSDARPRGGRSCTVLIEIMDGRDHRAASGKNVPRHGLAVGPTGRRTATSRRIPAARADRPGDKTYTLGGCRCQSPSRMLAEQSNFEGGHTSAHASR